MREAKNNVLKITRDHMLVGRILLEKIRICSQNSSVFVFFIDNDLYCVDKKTIFSVFGSSRKFREILKYFSKIGLLVELKLPHIRAFRVPKATINFFEILTKLNLGRNMVITENWIKLSILFFENPNLKQKVLAEIMGVSDRTVRNIIRLMKHLGLLEKDTKLSELGKNFTQAILDLIHETKLGSRLSRFISLNIRDTIKNWRLFPARLQKSFWPRRTINLVKNIIKTNQKILGEKPKILVLSIDENPLATRVGEGIRKELSKDNISTVHISLSSSPEFIEYLLKNIEYVDEIKFGSKRVAIRNFIFSNQKELSDLHKVFVSMTKDFDCIITISRYIISEAIYTSLLLHHIDKPMISIERLDTLVERFDNNIAHIQSLGKQILQRILDASKNKKK